MCVRPIRSSTLAVLLSASVFALAQRGPGGPPPGGGRGGPGGVGGAIGAPSGPGGMMPPGTSMGNRGSAPAASPVGPRNAPQLGPPGRWWDDRKMARNLNLRGDQQKRMDDIFDLGKGNLLQLYSNLQREESRLGAMSSAELSDESKVFASIDRVAQARAELEKANAHILLQIRKELDASQLAALDREIATLR